jgi:hypothetical protein
VALSQYAARRGPRIRYVHETTALRNSRLPRPTASHGESGTGVAPVPLCVASGLSITPSQPRVNPAGIFGVLAAAVAPAPTAVE